MPRPKKPGVEPKRRSRNGCWPCKARKVKCGEEKPCCANCERQGETCDYSIRLNWGGRTKREKAEHSEASSAASGSPYESSFMFEPSIPSLLPSTPELPSRSQYASRSTLSPPTSSQFLLDADLARFSNPQTPPAMTRAVSADRSCYFPTSEELPSSVPYTQAQFQTTFDYPSTTLPGFEPFNYSSVGFPSVTAEMPPPQGSIDSLGKRQRYTYSLDSPATTVPETYSPNPGPATPYSPYMTMPLTPNSSVGSEDPSLRVAAKRQNSQYPPPDLRRMSVQSLIHGNSSPQFRQYTLETEQGRQYTLADTGAITYGYDIGLPDLDTPNNDDFSALSLFNPQDDIMDMRDSAYHGEEPHDKNMAYDNGGYYAKPVPIKISKSLGQLPPMLMENQMNLMYFNHFLDNTARVLVPHNNCDRNPFREILPELAVRDPIIMNLLLAYSAAHRARMFNRPEPSNRIALWVQDVFPKLRQTLLDDPSDASDNTLAAVIMMASLEIISSGTFEVPVSWQDHLSMARQMIIARGGPRGMGSHNSVAHFLSRWFAYLDVVGSFSGNKNNLPLSSTYWSSENVYADEDFEIDCLMGFTPRCIGCLARISELAKLCEHQRIDENGNVRESWFPAPEIVQEAVQVRRQLEEGLLERNIRKGCNHASRAASESEAAWDATEIYATNELFHWAGLIHLYRRVLGKPATDIEVQHAVREIVGLLYKIRKGSTAEACLLFPMFAAGCSALDHAQRDRILDRVRGVEGLGMNHVSSVGKLLKTVWETGKPWESLVSGEFFG